MEIVEEALKGVLQIHNIKRGRRRPNFGMCLRWNGIISFTRWGQISWVQLILVRDYQFDTNHDLTKFQVFNLFLND